MIIYRIALSMMGPKTADWICKWITGVIERPGIFPWVHGKFDIVLHAEIVYPDGACEYLPTASTDTC